MRETLRELMEFTPKGLDLDEVREHITDLPHVSSAHDLHASTVATGLPTITAYAVLDDECFTDGHAPEIPQDIKDCVAKHFEVSIHHSTFQLETETMGQNEKICASRSGPMTPDR